MQAIGSWEPKRDVHSFIPKVFEVPFDVALLMVSANDYN
jgi:hypothetical protein